MSVPDSVEPGAPSGLFASLRSFWSVLLAILYTRLDLATAELEEEATRSIQLIIVTLAGMLCLSMAIFFLSLFIIAYYWYTHRLLVLGLVFGVYLIASVILLLISRSMLLNRPKFLSQTLTELRRDVEGLRAATIKTGETKP